VPVDWAAGRLVERYHLPWHTALPVVFYILSENRGFLESLEPLEVDISYETVPLVDSSTLTVTIEKVDEFVSKKDWDRVWERII
jgi:hypothetical protein